MERNVYSAGSGQTITLFHCRTLAPSIQQKHFVLSVSQLEEGALTQRTRVHVLKAERERKNRHDFLTRDPQIPARPSLSETERATNLEKARRWLHELDSNPSEFYRSGILAS